MYIYVCVYLFILHWFLRVCAHVLACVCVCMCTCVCVCVSVWERERVSEYICDMEFVNLRLQHTETHCNTLHHTATCYNNLQYTATHEFVTYRS